MSASSPATAVIPKLLSAEETLANLRHFLGDFFGIAPEGVHNKQIEVADAIELT